MTVPADDARQGLEEITIGLDRVRTSLAGVFTNAAQAVEEQHARVAAAEQRARIAEKELCTLRAGIRSLGGDPTTVQNLWAQLRMRTQQWREAQQDAERFKADHLAACRTIAEMHEAATGRTGMGPLRGVVEDVADVRARAELLDQELNRRSVYTAPSDAAEERIRSLTHQVAELRRCNARQAETIRETTGRANQAELDASRAEATLARVRNARTTADAWTEIGTYYHLTATEAGRRARAWRTTDEREHDRHRRNLAAVFALSADTTTFEELTEYAAKTLTRGGERLLAAGKRADTAEAAMSRVRALHSAVVYNGRTICTDCSGYADGSTDNGPAPFPCLTLAALDTPEEG